MKEEQGNPNTPKLKMIPNHLTHKFADYLNTKANRHSLFKKKLALIFLGGFVGILCASQIIHSFQRPTYQIFVQDSISYPNRVTQPTPATGPSEQIEYRHVLAFQRYLDSLQSSYSGQGIYDSIIQSRPGLQDSIRLFIKKFQQYSQ